MTGSKTLKPLLIGKSDNSKSFKSIKIEEVDYLSN